MSSIPSVVQQTLNAQQQATQQKIDMAVIRKGMDVQKQTGQAINELLEQAVTVQRQLSEGRLDVRV
ncbi:MAG: putative motility protein [Rubripirellula sp.]|nr:putative motility protein [Rubripirellula sp.]